MEHQDQDWYQMMGNYLLLLLLPHSDHQEEHIYHHCLLFLHDNTIENIIASSLSSLVLPLFLLLFLLSSLPLLLLLHSVHEMKDSDLIQRDNRNKHLEGVLDHII